MEKNCRFQPTHQNLNARCFIQKIFSYTAPLFFIGLCSTQFKFRYANHKKTFKGGVYENETKLSKYVCVLKRKNIDLKITWEVLKRAQPIANGINLDFKLCLKKSMAVINSFKKEGCLNKRSDFISSCQKMKKLLLKQNKL